MNTYYHLVSEDDFKKFSDGEYYLPPSLEQEGFIHLSTKEQVEDTYRRFYSAFPSLLLLELKIYPDELDLREDYIESEKMHFPHLYGKMPLSVVEAKYQISFDNDCFHYKKL